MKKSISIIGGGASALTLAAFLDETKYHVSIYERNTALGRKFLVAGDGGLNLTHSEEMDLFVTRYSPPEFLAKSLRSFTNIDLQHWMKQIGIDTFVGSSKRVFPVKGISPIEVLNAMLFVLKFKNVQIKTQHAWKGWTDTEELIFANKTDQIHVKSDYIVFSLGGASWKVTGSDGEWRKYFIEKGIQTKDFEASNCAVKINWPAAFIENSKGSALKNIEVECDGEKKKGELSITAFGLEGGAVYALTDALRKQLKEKGQAQLFLDLKPSLRLQKIKEMLSSRSQSTISKQLQELVKLDQVQRALLKAMLSKDEFLSVDVLANRIKKFPIIITDLAPMDEAISTVGGIILEEVDGNFQLNKLPNHYCMGEMLDWNAPTGGYLLQGCFSMGADLATYFNSEKKER